MGPKSNCSGLGPGLGFIYVSSEPRPALATTRDIRIDIARLMAKAKTVRVEFGVSRSKCPSIYSPSDTITSIARLVLDLTAGPNRTSRVDGGLYGLHGREQ